MTTRRNQRSLPWTLSLPLMARSTRGSSPPRASYGPTSHPGCGRAARVDFGVDLYNIFNVNTPISYDRTYDARRRPDSVRAASGCGLPPSSSRGSRG